MPDKTLTGVTLADLERQRLAFATLPEAACLLRVQPRTVRKGIAHGTIPATRVEGVWRVPLAWLRDQVYKEPAA